MEMNEILQAVRTYIKDKNAAKTWTAGQDFVNYAGPLFDEEEKKGMCDKIKD